MDNIIAAQLRAHFTSYSEITDVETQNELTCGVLMYLFRGISSADLTAILRDYLGDYISVMSFRQRLLGNGYLLRNVKGYLYTLAVKNAFLCREDALPIAKDFHIRKEDIILGRYLNSCDDLQELLAGYTEVGYKCLTLPFFSRVLNKIAEDTQEYTAKFVYRKLRFIYQSNGMEPIDFTNDFIAKGIQSILVMYPCVESRLHALNIAKQAIHNHGINTILKYTSKGRQTLVRDAYGCFSSKKISLDLLRSVRLSSDDSYLAANLNGDTELIGLNFSPQAKQDLEIAILQLMRQASTKQKKAIKLFMGEYCPVFSDWLHTEKNIKMNNVDYYNRLLSRNSMHLFFNNAFDFLRVSPSEGQAFLQRLRDECS